MNFRMDSLANKTEIAIMQREKSLKIFEKQNKLLEQSNKLTEQIISNDSANVEIYSEKIKIISFDSVKYKCEIPFYNIGKRNATKFSDLIVFVFKNNKGTYFNHVLIKSPYSKNGSVIPPLSNTIATNIFINKKFINNHTSGGTIVIYYNYYDEILKKYNKQESKFDFNKNWEQSISNILNEGDIVKEIGLNEYLKKHNIKLNLDIY